MKKVRITVTFDIEDDWYEAERKTKKERVKLYEEEFSDIEILENHMPRSNGIYIRINTMDMLSSYFNNTIKKAR